MAEDDDFLTVIEDGAGEAPAPSGARWKIAVIDDDPAVHEGTRFALYDYVLNRQGLEIIIDAAGRLFDFRSMQRLAEGVLTQIASLLNVECAGILVLREVGDETEKFSVLAGSRCDSRLVGREGAPE